MQQIDFASLSDQFELIKEDFKNELKTQVNIMVENLVHQFIVKLALLFQSRVNDCGSNVDSIDLHNNEQIVNKIKNSSCASAAKMCESVHGNKKKYACQIMECGKVLKFRRLIHQNRNKMPVQKTEFINQEIVPLDLTKKSMANLSETLLEIDPYSTLQYCCKWPQCTGFTAERQYSVIRHIRAKHMGVLRRRKKQRKNRFVDARKPTDYVQVIFVEN